jgi:hypothetical protein
MQVQVLAMKFKSLSKLQMKRVFEIILNKNFNFKLDHFVTKNIKGMTLMQPLSNPVS